jgi:hypothetical protein
MIICENLVGETQADVMDAAAVAYLTLPLGIFA